MVRRCGPPEPISRARLSVNTGKFRPSESASVKGFVKGGDKVF